MPMTPLGFTTGRWSIDESKFSLSQFGGNPVCRCLASDPIQVDPGDEEKVASESSSCEGEIGQRRHCLYQFKRCRWQIIFGASSPSRLHPCILFDLPCSLFKLVLETADQGSILKVPEVDRYTSQNIPLVLP